MAKKAIAVRELETAEYEELLRLSRSKTAQHRMVMRAQIVLLRYQGVAPGEVARQVGLTDSMVSSWVRRFNAEGIAGLEDRKGRGRKAFYTQDQRSRIIMIAKTHPQNLNLPFGYWSLERLVTYLRETDQVRVSRSQLRRILESEGLRWYQEKTYFTEGSAPDFVEKRGPS